ncbi:MAG: 3-deoxy-manno-octulosonate cytidylyltransferase, partial [Deltaproteobacteria bacterium]|nr:3-deoxy-manno-octulosonate cytidylyltransferase [Deltaproteobacteria bacterium]
MKVTVIIPARYESTRLKGKPLMDIAGKPIIQWVYERAKRVSLVDDVIVATDHQEILERVRGFGGKVVLTSTHHRSGTERVAEVSEGLDARVIVNVQGDEPLIEPAMIDEAIRPLLQDKTIPMGTLMTRIWDSEELNNPNVVKVVTDRNGFALYFSRLPIPYLRSEGSRAGTHPKDGWRVKGQKEEGSRAQGVKGSSKEIIPPLKPSNPGALEPLYYKHIGIYVYRREFLLQFARMEPTPLEEAEGLEQLRALENGY